LTRLRDDEPSELLRSGVGHIGSQILRTLPVDAPDKLSNKMGSQVDTIHQIESRRQLMFIKGACMTIDLFIHNYYDTTGIPQH